MIKKKCPYCYSSKTIKWGYRKNKRCMKQIRYCKVCKRKFTVDNQKHVPNYPKYVIQAAMIISERLSYRDTSDCISMMYGYKPSYSIIIKWKNERLKKLFRRKRRKRYGYSKY